MYAVVPLNLQRHIRRVAIACHVLKTHLAVVVEARGDDAHRRFDLVLARCDAAHRGQRHPQADRTMPAHVQAEPTLLKKITPAAQRGSRGGSSNSNEHVGTAWFVHHGGAEPVGLPRNRSRRWASVPLPKSGPPATTTRSARRRYANQ